MPKSKFNENNIYALRKMRGLSQQSLADFTGTTQATIMRLENRSIKLSFEWCKRLAPFLHVEPANIMFSETELTKAEAVARSVRLSAEETADSL